MYYSLKSTQKGFSIIEVMIALSIMAVVALLFTSMFEDMLQGQNTGRFLSTVTTFHDELQADMSSKAACLNTLSGKVILKSTTLPITQIKDASGNILYTTGVTFADGVFKIKTVNISVDSTYTGTSGQGTMVVTYESVPKVTGPNLRVRNFKLDIERSGTNVVTGCIAKAKMSDGIWRRLTTALNTIYFTDGYVGIGLTNPSEELQVDGNVLIGAQTTRSTSLDRGQLAQSSTFVQTHVGNFTLDWDNGNIQEANTFLCDAANTITMNNIRDGAAYSLLLSGTAAHSGKCVFAAAGYSFVTTGGNVAPTAGKDVLFTFAVINKKVVYSMMDNLK